LYWGFLVALGWGVFLKKVGHSDSMKNVASAMARESQRRKLSDGDGVDGGHDAAAEPAPKKPFLRELLGFSAAEVERELAKPSRYAEEVNVCVFDMWGFLV
jgi:hypothetical protein